MGDEDEDENDDELSMRTQFGSLAHQVRGSDHRIQDRLQILEGNDNRIQDRLQTLENLTVELKDALMQSALVPGGIDPPAGRISINSCVTRTSPEPPRATPPPM